LCQRSSSNSEPLSNNNEQTFSSPKTLPASIANWIGDLPSSFFS
jgi:hypothetical protein